MLTFFNLQDGGHVILDFQNFKLLVAIRVWKINAYHCTFIKIGQTVANLLQYSKRLFKI